MNKKSKSVLIKNILSHLILVFMSIIIIYPLVWTIGASLNPGHSLISTSIIPKNPTLDHYRDLFAGKESLQYVSWLKNSLKISVFTMIFSTLSVIYTGYAFSRFRFKGRKQGLIIFLLLQMIPQFSALVALFVLAQMLGMMNSHWLLVFLYTGGQIPMNTYLMKGYMDSVPIELDESAKIDGARLGTILWQLLVPLSKPMISVVAMNSFSGPLGDFVLSSVILRDPSQYTLPIGLFNLVKDVMGASYTTFAAGAILISIPIVIVFMMLQNNFVSGLTAGGIKG